jgi:hypothetical protein
MKDEFGHVLAELHDILNNWKNYFSQVLKIHKVSDVKQRKVSTCCCYVIRMQGKIMMTNPLKMWNRSNIF